MFIVSLLSWWYGSGWKGHVLAVRERLASSLDYFSINLLIKNLFSPFRQISASNVSGSIGLLWRAFVDRTISRIVGLFVRLILMIIGVIWISLQAILGIISVVLWATVPFLPILGFIAALAGWAPSW